MLLFQSSLGALELGFIALACLLTFLAEWLVLRWLGKGGWPTAAKAAGWGLAPPVVAILGSWAFVRTKFFSETLAWTMIMFLPLFLFLAVLLAAWVVKLIVQWKISGPAGALVVGLVVFPALSHALAGGKTSLWTLMDQARPTRSLADAVMRNDEAYLKEHLNEKTRGEIFGLALTLLNPEAAALAVRAGANPNELVTFPQATPRTPLVAVIGSTRTQPEPARQRGALIKRLLELGADPNLASPKVAYFESSPNSGKVEYPLDLAGWLEDEAVLKLLRDAGATAQTEGPYRP